MGNPNKYSPNWYWLQLGYTIVRNGHKRTILDDRGNNFFDSTDYKENEDPFITELNCARETYDNKQMPK